MTNISYISWNYGRVRDINLHLVRYKDGSSELLTDIEMVRRGLAEWKYGKK